ncbi:hypothetical protein Mal64_35030 [Pseudobythopirellula maris]|uniref:Uncharacterized protein n=1 Tax=Pseudobythopirellula maris TaxID=2527991 RepID=A0A5C5ZH71_9BACT|nr:hypothetical protein Mal64_35030 [Pseudobythopirellula maris]
MHKEIRAGLQTILVVGGLSIAVLTADDLKPFAIVAYAFFSFFMSLYGLFGREDRLRRQLSDARDATIRDRFGDFYRSLEAGHPNPRPGLFRAHLYLRQGRMPIEWFRAVYHYELKPNDKDAGIRWWRVGFPWQASWRCFRWLGLQCCCQGLVWDVCVKCEYGLFLRRDNADVRGIFGLSKKQAMLTEGVTAILAFPIRSADNPDGGRIYAVLTIDTSDETAASQLAQVASDIEGNPEHPLPTLVDILAFYVPT